MAETAEKAVVRKSLRVQIPPERAFSVFVDKMEAWIWKAQPASSVSAAQSIRDRLAN